MQKIVPMTKSYASEYVGWEYEPPFDFYNIPKERHEEELQEILSVKPPAAWFAVLDSDGSMAGFFEFSFNEVNELEIGLGLRPDLTGRGLGLEFVKLGISKALQVYPDYKGDMVLRVLDTNERAVKVYERAGFREYKRSDFVSYGKPVIFICMRRGMESAAL